MCEERLIWTNTLQSHRLFMYITLKFPSTWQTKHIYCVDQNSRGSAKWMNNFSSKTRKALVTWALKHIFFAMKYGLYIHIVRFAVQHVLYERKLLLATYIHFANNYNNTDAISFLFTSLHFSWSCSPFSTWLNEHKITILTKCYLCSGFLLAFTIRHIVWYIYIESTYNTNKCAISPLA